MSREALLALEAAAAQGQGLAAVAKTTAVPCDRLLIELCASPTSVLGHEKYFGAGCKTERLTAADDVTTAKGLAKALQIVEGHPDGVPLLL